MRKLDEDSIVRYHNSTRICGGVVFGVSGVACVRCFSFWCDFSLFLYVAFLFVFCSIPESVFSRSGLYISIYL